MPAFVKRLGQVAISSAGTVTTLTLAVGAAKGNRVVIGYGSDNSALDAASHTFADSKGNTYAEDLRISNGQITALIASAPLQTALVAGDTISVTTNVSTFRRVMDVLELSDAGAPDVWAGQPSSGSTTAVDSGATPTRTIAAAIQIGLVVWSSSATTDTFTPGANYTGTDNKVVAGTSNIRYVDTMHHVWATTGANNVSGTLSVGHQWIALTVVYPPSPAGGAGGLADRIPISSLVNGGLAR